MEPSEFRERCVFLNFQFFTKTLLGIYGHIPLIFKHHQQYVCYSASCQMYRIILLCQVGTSSDYSYIICKNNHKIFLRRSCMLIKNSLRQNHWSLDLHFKHHQAKNWHWLIFIMNWWFKINLWIQPNAFLNRPQGLIKVHHNHHLDRKKHLVQVIMWNEYINDDLDLFYICLQSFYEQPMSLL